MHFLQLLELLWYVSLISLHRTDTLDAGNSSYLQSSRASQDKNTLFPPHCSTYPPHSVLSCFVSLLGLGHSIPLSNIYRYIALLACLV